MPRLTLHPSIFGSAFARRAGALLLCVATAPALALDAAREIAQPEPLPETKASSLPSLHSDLKFSMFAPPRRAVPADNDAQLKAQTSRITASLQSAARGLYGDRMNSLGAFDVYIADSREAETLSSATGKIALYGGIADLNPADDWLAFVIAREMGHVLAGHHDKNSTASLLTSLVMNILIPGSGLVKSVLSLAGSQVASASGADKQLEEADEIALRLLEAAGYTSRSIALNLALGPMDDRLGQSSWAAALRKSALTVMARQSILPRTAPALRASGAVLAQADGGTRPAGAVGAAGGNVAAPGATASAFNATADVAVAPALPGAAPLMAPAALAVPVALRRSVADEMPLVRARPSGVAGPLMLGGFAVPSRRIE